MVEDELGNDRKRWGTWEELVLGGAVVRHGYHNWDAVALELQSRTLFPFLFTPQVCKAKYEDLQERYSGSSSWFEELRKRRVEELKRELEKSEDSIGSLESKLESLKSEKGTCNNVDYSSSRAESPAFLKSEGNESSSGKEASKDGLSAGSFTQETQVTWSPQCEATIKTCTELTKRKPEDDKDPPPPRLEKFPSIDMLEEMIRSEGGVSIRKRRGKRRKKDLTSNAKEGIVGENNLLASPDVVTKEVLVSPNGQTARSPETDDHKPCTSKQATDDFMKIFDSIMENEHASVFRRRLDSQKRARYKKMIRQHMDLETIRGRISKRSITSHVQLYRDLLLVANNALVFYSKCTREYKCAFMLRSIVTQKLHQHHQQQHQHQQQQQQQDQHEQQHSKAMVDSPKPIPQEEGPRSPMPKAPAKPRSARPFNQKLAAKITNTENGSNIKPNKQGKEQPQSKVESPSSAESSASVKKSPGRKGKVGRVKRASAGLQAETPMKVRRKPRLK